MKKIIVTTTIYKPTKALMMYTEIKDWELIVVGDKKTPHEEYEKLQNLGRLRYLHPNEQEEKYKKVSDTIGWNCIQRRNIGFLEAYNEGADIVATVDDDNIPYESWGKNLYVGLEIECDLWEPNYEIFDPLSATNVKYLWHRGFPIQYVPNKTSIYKGKTKRKVLVQADLWDGDPDIDAMARLTFKPCVKFDINKPFCSNKIAPFNSQNTFLAREVLPFYSVLPHVGRMDDIWGSYILQHFFPNSLVFNNATVYQDRNEQDLITNLEKELLGYRLTINLVKDLKNWKNYLPKQALNFFDAYMYEMNKNK